MVRSHSRLPDYEGLVHTAAPFSLIPHLPELHARHHTARRQPAPFDHPVTVDEVAASIGAGLRKAALAGRVDGKLVDTSFVIDSDAQLAIVTDKDPDGLEVIRHSTAHLLAQAVKQLFPEAQVTIGPVIEDGFYYDFAYKRPFTPEDLAAIEARMAELAKADQKVSRRVMPRDEAVEFFKRHGRELQGRDHRQHPGQGATSACTARATGWTCAAARTCLPPASSRPSS